MGIKEGLYNISTVKNENLVGRALVEDRSFNPKRIVVLEQSIPALWTVKDVGGNGYTLTTRDSPTANLNNLVFAILLDQPPPTLWRIIEAPDYGPNSYFIALADDESQGWVAPRDDSDKAGQIEVQFLKGNVSEAFIFTPSSKD